MNPIILRSLFLILLFGSLVIRYTSIETRTELIANYDISRAISDVAHMNGFLLHNNPVLPPKVLSSIVYFEQPGCDSLSFAMPFAISNDARTKLNRVAKPGYVHRVHYFDKIWAEQDRVALYLQWFEQSALSIVGRSDFVPVKSAFFLATPAACVGGRSVNWTLVWDKARFQRTVQTQNAAVTHTGRDSE
ncbi:MAG: hypothetical protein K8F25_07125 [Fimbriimonadaceae bacterium]|nr:hypothetical protein [Alphaproteobacteria bacterium]